MSTQVVCHGANAPWRADHPACGARAARPCLPCAQEHLLQMLLDDDERTFQATAGSVWRPDSTVGFPALPVPLRLRADMRYTGRGVTMAMVDSAFYPHPDLVLPRNRIRAWVDVTGDEPVARFFHPDELPRWPGWDARGAWQWHGMMTTAVATGNGRLSGGLYRGMAQDADLVLVQTLQDDGHIGNETIARALRWLRAHGPALGVRIVNFSVGGDPVRRLPGNAVDAAVADLVDTGMLVVAAAGNNPQGRLAPPATAPAALTVGGLDDKNSLDQGCRDLWHSTHGATAYGAPKPDMVAPSIWVPAPLLPGSPLALEARQWFTRRAQGDEGAQEQIAALRLVTPHYQHVDGTSFAAPLVASVAACMLEANSTLTPALIRDVLAATARPVLGAPAEHQGAGAIDARKAIAMALGERHQAPRRLGQAPRQTPSGIELTLHHHRAAWVTVLGSWDAWQTPGQHALQVEPGLWCVNLPPLAPGRYAYKFLVDGTHWVDDRANPCKASDGYGGLNSLLRVRHRTP